MTTITGQKVVPLPGGGTAPAIGYLMWQLWPGQWNEENEEWIAQSAFRVDFEEDGSFDLEVEPSTEMDCWKTWIRIPGLAETRFAFSVPDVESIAFDALVEDYQVDPETLQPLPSVPTVQEALDLKLNIADAPSKVSEILVAGDNVTLNYDSGAGTIEISASASGGGAVTSVNGQDGAVVLDAGDVGAATTAQGAKADAARPQPTYSANANASGALDLSAFASDAIVHRTLTGAVTSVVYPLNPTAGQQIILRLTGNYAVSWGTVLSNDDDPPQPSADIALITLFYDGASWWVIAGALGA